MSIQGETPPTEKAGWVKDARGRSVSQLDPVMMHLLHRGRLIPSDVLREMAQKVGLGITRANRLACWGAVVGLIFFGIALAICFTRWLSGSFGPRDFVRSLLPYLGVWSMLVGLWVRTRATRHQRIAKVMLQHLRCPHCGYDLRLLPVDPTDGATICPECGCAWRLAGVPE